MDTGVRNENENENEKCEHEVSVGSERNIARSVTDWYTHTHSSSASSIVAIISYGSTLFRI